MHYDLMANMPEIRLLPLMEKFSQLMMEHKSFSDTFSVV